MNSCSLPFGDLVSYCLMPNHFHWLFSVNSVTIPKSEYYEHYTIIENQRRRSKSGHNYIRYKSEVDLKEEILINEVH